MHYNDEVIKIGRILKTIGLVTIVTALGMSGVAMRECQHGCTSERLKRTSNCKKAKISYVKAKEDKSNFLWDYLRGYKGKLSAYEEYIDDKCKKK